MMIFFTLFKNANICVVLL